ncbi:MAG: CotH kinase family protein [Paludibacteraceae bacterium]|nr:CotH kinase family protein [Paludibacteraceae bacterium]
MKNQKLLKNLITRWLLLGAMLLGCSASVLAYTGAVYLAPNDNWKKDNAWFATYAYNGTDNNKWYKMEDNGDGHYVANIDEDFTSVIFCRMNPAKEDLSWDSKWNQTSDLTFPTNGDNLYTIAADAWDKGDGTWSTYTPPTKCVTFSTQPSGESHLYNIGDAAATLTVAASSSDETAVTYQWYSNTTRSNTSGTVISGATNASYTPSTSTLGTLYYYCEATGCDPEETVASSVSGSYTVYKPNIVIRVKKDGLFSSGTPYIYAWYYDGSDHELTGAWKGAAMEVDPENDGWYVYTVTTPYAPIKVIFNKNSDSDKTADITGIVDDACYLVNSDKSYSSVDCPAPSGDAPTVLLAEAPTVEGVNVTLYGYLKYTGCQPVKNGDYGFVWSATEADINKEVPTGTKTPANQPGTDLEPETGAGTEFTLSNHTFDIGHTYYYKAYATNAVGTGYSDEYRAFTVEDGCGDTFEMQTNYEQTINACDANKGLALVATKGNFDGATITWTPESGLSAYNIYNPTFNGTESKVYSVRVEKSATCYRNATYAVTYNDNAPKASILGAGKVMQGSDLNITGNATPATGFTWQVLNSESEDVTSTVLTNANTLTPTFNSSDLGAYTISLTTATTGECPAAVAEATITVTDGFIVYFKYPAADHAFYEASTDKKSVWMLTNATGDVADNTGGTQMRDTTDCNGVNWAYLKVKETSISNVSFHAKNDNAQNWWATFTRKYEGPVTEDTYFETDAFEEGVRGTPMHVVPTGVSVSAVRNNWTFNSNSQRDFVALYAVSSNICVDKNSTYQWQFSTDNSNWSNYSTTSTLTGDAGVSDNIRVRTAGWYRIIVTTADGTYTSDGVQVNSESGTAHTICSQLPVIIVKTNADFPVCNDHYMPCDACTSGDCADMKRKISCDVQIFWNAEGETSASNLYYDRKARMNYRGSSSMNFKKKSYAFVSGKDNCKNGNPGFVDTGKLAMFGLGSNAKDWVLYAAAPDASLMRNKITYDTYADMTGLWASHSTYVDLYIDGEYKGVYVFMEKNTQGSDRINVSKDGYIFKFDKTDIADRYDKLNPTDDDKMCTFMSKYSGRRDIETYEGHVDQMFEIEYPEREDYMDTWPAKVSALRDRINAVEDAIKEGKWEKVRTMIDYESWADWFIMTEFTKNIDGFRASNYFAVDNASAPIKATPIWDYELGLNNDTKNDNGNRDPEGWLHQNANMHSDAFPIVFWLDGNGSTGEPTGTESVKNTKGLGFYGLLDDPCFVNTIKNRWATHYATNGALNATTLSGKVDAIDAVLSATGTCGKSAVTKEFEKWSCSERVKSVKNVEAGYGVPEDYNSQKTRLKGWFSSRGTGLNTLVGNLSGKAIIVTPSELTTTPYTPVTFSATAVGGTPITWSVTGTNSYLMNVEDHTVYDENPETDTVILKPATNGTAITATTTDDVCGMGEVSETVTVTVNADSEVCD